MVPNELEGKHVEEFRQRVLDKLCAKSTIAPHEIHMLQTPKAKSYYLNTSTLTNLANDIFEGMWSTDVVEGPSPFEDLSGKYVCIVQLNVYGFHPIRDFGVNSGLQTEKPMQFKSAITDGMKRVMRKLGDQFGLFIYDKGFSAASYAEEYKEKNPNYAPPKFGPTFSEPPSGRRQGSTAYGANRNNRSAGPPAPAPKPAAPAPVASAAPTSLEQRMESKRQRVVELALQLGMSREQIDERVKDTSDGRSLAEMSETYLDLIINSSQAKLDKLRKSKDQPSADRQPVGAGSPALNGDPRQMGMGAAMDQ